MQGKIIYGKFSECADDGAESGETDMENSRNP